MTIKFSVPCCAILLQACAPSGESMTGPPKPNVVVGSPANFRMDTLALRDPHVMYAFGGCRDITDTPVFGQAVNPQIEAALTEDKYNGNDLAQGGGALPPENPDGLLDLSLVLRFADYNPDAPSSTVGVELADCTAPASTTSCKANSDIPSVPLQVMPGCEGILPGTTSGYMPPVVQPSGSCFKAGPFPFPLSSGGISLTLQDSFISAQYDGQQLVNGLMRGFLSETDAAAQGAIETPIGTIQIPEVLPGGAGNCSTGDDTDMGGATNERGWYFYLNFTATSVAFM